LPLLFINMKVFFRRIHLYLGLTAGLVIMSCCLTGAILVFQKELEQAFHKERYFVKAGEQKLSADSLVLFVKKAYPKAKVNSIKLYTSNERTAEVNASMADKKATEKTPAQKNQPAKKTEPRTEQRAPMLTAFVNPYTGKIIELYNPRQGFFFSALALHRWLLGSNNGPGKYITGISTLLFIFILITGIILWGPKTKNILVQRLKIKSTAGWKRLNHDLHIVLGFYTAIFLLVFAFTALAWSFEWFNKGIYKVTASSIKPPEPPLSAYTENKRPISFDTAFSIAEKNFSKAQFYTIVLPKDSAAAIAITSLSADAIHETATDVLYIDQYSGKVLKQYLFSDRNLGARMRATFRPVHVGSIWGLPSKIIALVVCLLGTSFPITGTVLWLNRTRKKKKLAPKKELAEA
jgi:uncharacterized iron-regulated membrane protein